MGNIEINQKGAMSKLIIVCGLSGSGKTTLAEAVSRELGVVCLHKDSIKERLYDAMGLATLEDSKRLGVWTIELLMGLVEEQIARGVDVMVEAPFKFPEDYAEFERWSTEYGVQIYSIICEVDNEERYRRYVSRIDSGQRHHAHHDAERVQIEKFHDDHDYAAIPGARLCLDTSEPLEKLVQKVVAHVGGQALRQ